MNSRYQEFYQVALDKLNKLPAQEFEQYKQSIITEMKQPPQTFYEEVGRYSSDFNRNIFTFDTREKVLALFEKVTQQQVIEYYQKAVMKRQGLALASQVIGQDVNEKTGYAPLKGWVFYPNASEFQKILPVKEDAK